MKKKIIIFALVLFIIFLLLPISVNQLKDGGSVEYRGLFYSVIKVKRINHEAKTGFSKGTIIKIFNKEIYNSYHENS